MVLKEFRSEDYGTVSRWWEAHGWHSVPEPFLAKTGLMAYDDDGLTPRAAFWLYRTDSAVMIGEWLVTNPDNSPKESYAALKLLVESAQLVADAAGAYFMTFLQDGSLKKLFEKHGFSLEEKPYIVAHYTGG